MQKEYIIAIIFAVISFIGLLLLIVAKTTIKPSEGPSGDKDRKKQRDMYTAGGILLGLGVIAVSFSILSGHMKAKKQRELAHEFFDRFSANDMQASEAICDRFMGSNVNYTRAKQEGRNSMAVCQNEAASLLNAYYKVPRYAMSSNTYGPQYNYQQAAQLSQKRVPVLPPALSQRKLQSVNDFELP